MSKWRPNGWLMTKVEKSYQDYPEEFTPFYAGFEAGADALLDCLKSQGQYGVGADFTNPAIDLGIERKGWLVFIPDEGELPSLVWENLEFRAKSETPFREFIKGRNKVNRKDGRIK